VFLFALCIFLTKHWIQLNRDEFQYDLVFVLDSVRQPKINQLLKKKNTGEYITQTILDFSPLNVSLSKSIKITSELYRRTLKTMMILSNSINSLQILEGVATFGKNISACPLCCAKKRKSTSYSFTS
jgi:hypothetical protein